MCTHPPAQVGTIVSQSSISFAAGAALHGAALSMNGAVTLHAAAVTLAREGYSDTYNATASPTQTASGAALSIGPGPASASATQSPQVGAIEAKGRGRLLTASPHVQGSTPSTSGATATVAFGGSGAFATAAVAFALTAVSRCSLRGDVTAV